MNNYLYLIGLLLLIACTSKEQNTNKTWGELPNVIRLESLKQTEFMLTMEHPIPKNFNVIYTPAFLFAWDEVEKVLGNVKLDKTNSNDFKLLVASTSHINSLPASAYSKLVVVEGEKIAARVDFFKKLEFENKLQQLDEKILFNNKNNVTAFGMNYFNEGIAKTIKILYYLNDNNFILEIKLKDTKNELILAKGLKKYHTLTNILTQTNDLIQKGKIESNLNQMKWKYEILENDIFSIPIVQFNIENNYKNLEQQEFLSNDNKKHLIVEAYQRTGFLLNEKGAVVESVAIAVADSVVPAVIEVQQPKRMVFDKPFVIIIKQKEQKKPYFMMLVNNTELMTKK